MKLPAGYDYKLINFENSQYIVGIKGGETPICYKIKETEVGLHFTLMSSVIWENKE